jgi:hypothetical protein
MNIIKKTLLNVFGDGFFGLSSETKTPQKYTFEEKKTVEKEKSYFN